MSDETTKGGKQTTNSPKSDRIEDLSQKPLTDKDATSVKGGKSVEGGNIKA